MICAFFGHRRVYTDLEPKLRRAITELIEEHRVSEFYFGCEGDFDRMVKRTLLSIQKEHEHIRVTAVLAYLDKKYDDLPDSVFPEKLEGVPPRFAIHRRNRIMVDMSDFVIVYVSGCCGGAFDAMRYALRKDKRVINLAE